MDNVGCGPTTGSSGNKTESPSFEEEHDNKNVAQNNKQTTKSFKLDNLLIINQRNEGAKICNSRY